MLVYLRQFPGFGFGDINCVASSIGSTVRCAERTLTHISAVGKFANLEAVQIELIVIPFCPNAQAMLYFRARDDMSIDCPANHFSKFFPIPQTHLVRTITSHIEEIAFRIYRCSEEYTKAVFASTFWASGEDHFQVDLRAAAGLRAGVPSIVVPFHGDQPFWGRLVADLGVGPRPIPRRKLTVERLAEALASARDDDAMRRRAADLGATIRTEDGIANAVTRIERVLPHSH